MLPVPEAIKLPVASSDTEHRKRSFNSESIPEEDNQPFHKKLHLLYLNLSSVEDQAWCPKHVGDCLATKPFAQFSGQKIHLNVATMLSCLNIENI
jgi:hypothetical protein